MNLKKHLQWRYPTGALGRYRAFSGALRFPVRFSDKGLLHACGSGYGASRCSGLGYLGLALKAHGCSDLLLIAEFTVLLFALLAAVLALLLLLLLLMLLT